MGKLGNNTGGTATAKRIDHFVSFKFVMTIDQIQEGVFTECSGLEMTSDVFEYQEGGLNNYVHKLPGRTKLSNVTLKRGFIVSNEPYRWYMEMQQNLQNGTKIERKPVTITLYSTQIPDEKPNQKVSWTLENALPVKWVGPSFNSGENAVSVETLEFAHEGISYKKG